MGDGNNRLAHNLLLQPSRGTSVSDPNHSGPRKKEGPEDSSFFRSLHKRLLAISIGALADPVKTLRRGEIGSKIFANLAGGV